jgi:CRP-like cAMP-binding protein
MHLLKFTKLYAYTFPQEVISEIEIRTYRSKDIILATGDEIDGFYFLIEGKYYVSSLEITGKELLLRYSKVPAILGDIEIFEHCEVQSNCIAAQPCEFVFVPIHTYKKYLQNDAQFTHLLLKELTYKLKTCTASSRVNALSPVSVRLAAYYCTVVSGKPDSEYILSNKLDEVASLIGTTKRHLNRILKKWHDEGTINRQGETIQFLKWDAIRSYSEGVRFE